ncbi:MAG: hypothetical protein ACFFFK_13115 [Candidatus Thorarchaeota archaeon]
MSESSMVEFVSITAIFLCVLPVMFTLMVAILMNGTINPEIRIAQAAAIALISGLILYGSTTYFIRKLHKQIVIAEKEKV